MAARGVAAEEGLKQVYKKRPCGFRTVFFVKSGRRGSNPRPSAWKANALSTELLPQFSGQRWIRTTEGVSQQIYSLPHLATLVFAPEKLISNV